MNTYISRNKFQFITDFSKHAYTDVKGNTHELNFNDLTIVERIMLSSYLTFLCSNDDSKTNKKDLYNLIFNFNNKRQRKTSYQDPFIEDLSNFIARQPYYFAFIKSHYSDIENDKTFIYRQQLNHSEMDVLYSLKFQRNYHSLMNVLYIIGVAKQNITTTYLNKIPMSSIYSHSTIGKKRVEEIFDKINSVSKNEVKYKIANGMVYFGNGFSIEEDEEYHTVEKQLFDKFKMEEDIISQLSLCEEKKEETPKTPIIVKKSVKHENKNNTSFVSRSNSEAMLNLDDFGITVEMCKNFLDENANKINNHIYEYPNYCQKYNIVKEVTTIYNLMLPIIQSSKSDIGKVWNGEFIKGEDGLNKKNIAIFEIQKIREAIFKYLENLFDEDKEKYKNTLYYFLNKYNKILEF